MFPSALLQLVGTIFLLSFCILYRAPVSPIGELLHASGALFFAAVARGIPLDGLALVAKVLHS